MKILFIHQNFPGQYAHLAPALAAAGHQVVALTLNQAPNIGGVTVARYSLARGSTAGQHPWVSDFEAKVIRGEACAKACQELTRRGFVPDIVCAHPGWGESLFVKDVWPDVPLLTFMEFFYAAKGLDTGFDPEFSDEDLGQHCRLRIKNANHLLTLEAMDWGVSPTVWQRSAFPARHQSRLSVIHDGIDTARVCPDPDAALTLASGRRLDRSVPVVTFVNRSLEPYRGFHRFMRALPELQRRRPDAQVVIIGGDGVSYGSKSAHPGGYRGQMLEELAGRIDLDRIHFLGRVPYDTYLSVLRISSAHVYLTVPFVLSWSMLEAMSAGCLVIGSDTPPVREALRHGENGLLVDFFDADALAETVSKVLAHPDDYTPLREAARRAITARYDLREICLPRHMALVDAVARRDLETARRLSD